MFQRSYHKVDYHEMFQQCLDGNFGKGLKVNLT